MIYNYLEYAAAGSAIISTILYFISFKTEKPAIGSIARIFFFLSAAIVLGLSYALMREIFAHNFQITYVYNHTSREMPDYLLASAFWAGQEGSILLWTLFAVLIGIFLQPFLRKRGIEASFMIFYGLIVAFMLAIMIAKTPFGYVWDFFENVEPGFMPKDGRGINPILENFWMAIHPPILFVGYAAMAAPYALALSSAVLGDFKNWARTALPWTIFASAFLGLGIFLGAFWSYETLGWGGYWGWDPVENSSLVPWVVSLALIHTLLVQKSTGGLTKTNVFLAIINFVLVLYATYLTRSGILGEISVHSFSDPGEATYAMLLGGLLAFLILGVVIAGISIGKNFAKTKTRTFDLLSKEFFLTLGSLTLLGFSAFVLIAVSSPVWTLAIQKALPALAESMNPRVAAVDPSFYDAWSLPFAVAALALCGAAIYLNWTRTAPGTFLKRNLPNFVISILGASAFILFTRGANDAGVAQALLQLLFMAAIIYCFATNFVFIFNKIRSKPESLGVYLSHVGFAVMVFGIVVSGFFSREATLALPEGETIEVFGRKLTYIGSERIDENAERKEKYRLDVKIEKNGRARIASPIFFLSDFNNRTSPFLEPGIRSSILADEYVSPISVSHTRGMETAALAAGEPISFDAGAVALEFVKFDMTRVREQTRSGGVLLGVVAKIRIDTLEIPDTLYAEVNMDNLSTESIPKKIGNVWLGFSDFRPNSENMRASTAIISYSEIDPAELAVKEVFSIKFSVKPGIFFVWAGAVLITIGFGFATIRYFLKK